MPLCAYTLIPLCAYTLMPLCALWLNLSSYHILIHGWYMVGTWLVHGWYMVGT